jgi:hypothetical protein
MAERDPPSIAALRVVALGAELPIMINRETPSGAYWDDPVRHVGDSGLDLEFVRFFDWDELGLRGVQIPGGAREEVAGSSSTGRSPCIGRVWSCQGARLPARCPLRCRGLWETLQGGPAMLAVGKLLPAE